MMRITIWTLATVLVGCGDDLLPEPVATATHVQDGGATAEDGPGRERRPKVSRDAEIPSEQ